MNKIIYFTIFTILAACSEKKGIETAYADAGDYEKYLEISNENEIEKLSEELNFWKEKISQQPRGFIYIQKLAGTQSRLFEKTGDVNYLYKAEENFARSARMVYGKNRAANLLTLSSLGIKKHEFRKANDYALRSMELTDEKFGPLLMQFDSEMELGNHEIAGSILTRNQQLDSFDYLVRLSKFKDHEGDLDSAIFYMEMAHKLVRRENSQRSIWADANLGDMYGHAGRIEDSYQKYLTVLERDPSYHYALKGIAWITFSADKNPLEAKRILTKIQSKTKMPDTYLLLAEIASSQGNEKEAAAYISSFLEEAQKEKYGSMYNKYLISIYLEQLRFEEALELAKNEIEARPTPATYDWMAWAFFQKGEKEKALKIYEQYVEGQSFEPELIYHMGVVFHELKKKRGRAYLMEALDASYELGPVVTSEIEKYLRG